MLRIGYWLLAVSCWLLNLRNVGATPGGCPKPKWAGTRPAPTNHEPRTMNRKAMRLNSLLFILVIGSCFTFTGCYDAREPDDLGYVMAIGLDKGKTNFLKMTLQIAVPVKIGGGGDGGGGGEGGAESSTIESVETPSVWSGLNMINSFTSRQVLLSHAKAVVISEELAREGILSYLHAMVRNREFRPNMRVLVTRTSAEDYIKSVTPKLELNPSKYYELNFKSGSYTGFTPDVTLNDFYLNTKSLHRQSVAILASVNKFDPEKDVDIQASTYKEKNKPYPFEGDFKAGDIPRKAELKSEIMGLAVFDGAKMVGELDGEEAAYYLMATGEYNYSFWTFPDPRYKDKFVILNVRQNRKPRTSVKIINGKPFIDLGLNLEADILSIQSGENYEDPGQVKFLEASAENSLKEGMMRTLDKAARQYHSDIFGFGRKAKATVLTWNQWEAVNWKGIFQNSEFNVNVDLNIRRPGLMIRSVPAVSSKGKE